MIKRKRDQGKSVGGEVQGVDLMIGKSYYFTLKISILMIMQIRLRFTKKNLLIIGIILI